MTGRFIFISFFLVAMHSYSFAQPVVAGYVDPAMNHNRLIREQTGDGVYKLVGPYKVVGTSYLFGEKRSGNIFSKEEKAYNIFLSYNTYNQEVEFYSTNNPDKPLVKEPGSLDSFIINADLNSGIIRPLKFIYGPVLGATDKSYFEEMYSGSRFSLYKKYKSDLGYVSSNYVQSELRQFDLVYDYFYTDTAIKGVKKIKPDERSVDKEFKLVKKISSVVNNEAYTVNPDQALIKAFEYLNN